MPFDQLWTLPSSTVTTLLAELKIRSEERREQAES